MVLEVFEGEFQEVVPDAVPFGPTDRTLDGVRFEDPELFRAPFSRGRGASSFKVVARLRVGGGLADFSRRLEGVG